MKETARAIIRYPFGTSQRRLNSVITTLDRVAVRDGKDEVYSVPGGGIGHCESPEDAARREVHEELGLVLGRLIPAGKVGRHHLFIAEDATGVIDQTSIQLDEVLGLGFLNSGRKRKTPPERMQWHLRQVVRDLLGKHPELQTEWPREVEPGFQVRGYFFTGNTNRQFYDWEQQQETMKKGRRFNAKGRS